MAKGDKKKAAAAPKVSKAKADGPKISDALRQAVKDLGGDDDDLELIAGIDSDEETSPPVTAAVKGKGKDSSTDERSIRKALGAFMKELDFASAAPEADEVDEDEEDGTESDSEGSFEDEEVDTGLASAQHVTEQRTETTKKVSVEAKPKADDKIELDSNGTSGRPFTLVSGDVEPSSASRVPASPSWPALIPTLPALIKEPKAIAPNRLQSLKARGLHLLEAMPLLARSSSSSDAAFISQILQNGTHQDKLAALILLIRESPVHAMKELGRLRTMAGWKEDGTIGGGGNKDQRLAVVKSLVDWWINGGGKEAGKLRYFADQPLLVHPQLTDRHLLMFTFEDWLKRWFFSLLQVLESLSHDTLPYIRVQALHLIFQLLSGNAEQEQNLLRLGVNKLGDTDRSVASKASYHLLQLLQIHPAMKGIVVREVSALVLKLANQPTAGASQSTHVRFDDPAPTSAKVKGKAKAEPRPSDPVTHARYYGVLTLTQIVLTSKDREVAAGLVELYFELFREILGEGLRKEKREPADDADMVGEEQIEKVAGKVEAWRGRRKKANPKEARKSALEKEEEVIESGEARLVAALLSGINRALPFAKLEESAFEKYMNTLFLITHTGSFNTTIQALQLVFQICSQTLAESTSSSSKNSIDRFYRTMYESLFDIRLMTSSKQAMYLNLMFKALKADTQITRVMAFVKRLLQGLGMHQPPFICGALYCLGELFETTPGLRRMLIEPEDDGDEHFVDAPEDGEVKPANPDAKSSTLDKSNIYDGRKREPLYAHADTTCLWELIPFTYHFHPTVSLQAQQLLLSEPISGSPDISLNTLVSFLDRFVYRNPKKTLQPKGASIMQPSAASDRTGMLVQNKGARALDSGYVNDEKFWKKTAAEIPADQLFFHKFFATKLAKDDTILKSKKTVQNDNEDSDVSDVSDANEGSDASPEADDAEAESPADSDAQGDGSELNEDEVWEAMVKSMPGGELDESDDEVDIDDSADFDGDSEDEEVDGVDINDDEVVEDDDDVDLSDAEGGSTDEDGAEDDSGDSEGFPDVEEDEDDLIPLNVVLDPTAAASSEDEDEPSKAQQGKRKRADDRKERRKKRKEMPMFASYEDYQAMIEGAASEED